MWTDFGSDFDELLLLNIIDDTVNHLASFLCFTKKDY